MLGHNRCLYCKKENPYSDVKEANKHDWGCLILRNIASTKKASGLVCPDCIQQELVSLYFPKEADNGK